MFIEMILLKTINLWYCVNVLTTLVRKLVCFGCGASPLLYPEAYHFGILERRDWTQRLWLLQKHTFCDILQNQNNGFHLGIHVTSRCFLEIRIFEKR